MRTAKTRARPRPRAPHASSAHPRRPVRVSSTDCADVGGLNGRCPQVLVPQIHGHLGNREAGRVLLPTMTERLSRQATPGLLGLQAPEDLGSQTSRATRPTRHRRAIACGRWWGARRTVRPFGPSWTTSP